MSVNELVRRIDESIETAKKILAAQVREGADRTVAPDGMKIFCQGIEVLIEEVYGGSNHLSGTFEMRDGYNPDKVAEGLRVLKDLRRLIAYSGEFGS